MDAGLRLDAHLAQSLDALLSLASLAAATGRPELALAANAALDPLIPFLDAPAEGVVERPADVAGERPHAEH